MALIDKAKMREPEDESPDDDYNDATDTAEPDEQEETGEGATPELIEQMQSALESKIPANLKSAVERIVLAGKKVMYSEGSKDLVQRELAGKAPIDAKIAHAAAGLILMLGKESRGTMPPDAATLAGALLVLEMCDLVLRIGMPLQKQDVRDALDQFVALTMMKAGANQEQIMGALGAGGAVSPGAGGATPDAPTPQGAMP